MKRLPRCVPCGRVIDFVSQRTSVRAPNAILPEPDNCRLCARPLTEEAERRAPLDGFVAAANGSARRETAAHGAVYGGDE